MNTAKTPNHFHLPRRLERLGELAYNLWWSWNPDAQNLYRLIDRTLWEDVYHNPVNFLRQVNRPALNAVINDRYYLELFDRVFKTYDEYLAGGQSWYKEAYPDGAGQQIAYFSFEFGLHESLPVYAGGLGVLSGDHLKEASDLGLPLVGIGFIYKQGYFSQHITEDGWQQTNNLLIKFDETPIMPMLDETGSPLMISIMLPGREVWARIWQVRVGRVSLYLLDSDVEENAPNDRQLNARLYTNDPELRISQEIMLGIGGVRALRKLGYKPTVWHMNEGHSAFMLLERVREMMTNGMDFQTAAKIISKTNVFTTHTPVPAGNDQFPLWLVDKYLANTWQDLKMTRDDFINLALHLQPWGEMFSMPVLALRNSDQRNAVSELHGHVSRRMWHFLWKDLEDEEEVPITYITNGVHTGSWLARRMRLLFDRYLGDDWMARLDEPELWDAVERIPDGELWAVRSHLKRKLLTYANERIRQQWMRGDIHPVQVIASGVMLEPYSLTLGFARRFATYKRADLIMHDFDRLLKIINDPARPVQIIFAGKAHPADEPGKLLIQQVYRAVKDSHSGGRLVFLEDYDINIARYLVQGGDVWLNTPRRPNEASGTSGMKAALNGVLNFSVLDGWWHEGYNGMNGWAIGTDEDYSDPNEQDAADAESLYETLENEIVPLYYHRRSHDNLPGDWITKMKENIRTLLPLFSTRRMLKEYMDQLYRPAMLAAGEKTKNTKKA
jgi:starch phosphorylase